MHYSKMEHDKQNHVHACFGFNINFLLTLFTTYGGIKAKDRIGEFMPAMRTSYVCMKHIITCFLYHKASG